MVQCPMCEGKGFLMGAGCGHARHKGKRFRVKFECMLCEGKRDIDAAIARDYLLERGKRLRVQNRAIARITDE